MTDLAELIPGRVYDRHDYGAPATPGGARRNRDDVVGMTVHWTTGRALGRPNTVDWVASIYRYHTQTLGWADIGYAYLVDKHGNVFVGRGRFRALAHATGYNRTWLGVAYLGGHSNDITAEGKAALIGLRNWLIEDGGMPGMTRLNGHRDLGSTHCPGDLLYRWVHDGMPAPDLDLEEARYQMLVYAKPDTPDFQSAMTVFATSRLPGVLTQDVDEARQAAERGETVIAVGGPAVSDLEDVGGDVEPVYGNDRASTLIAFAEWAENR